MGADKTEMTGTDLFTCHSTRSEMIFRSCSGGEDTEPFTRTRQWCGYSSFLKAANMNSFCFLDTGHVCLCTLLFESFLPVPEHDVIQTCSSFCFAFPQMKTWVLSTVCTTVKQCLCLMEQCTYTVADKTNLCEYTHFKSLTLPASPYHNVARDTLEAHSLELRELGQGLVRHPPVKPRYVLAGTDALLVVTSSSHPHASLKLSASVLSVAATFHAARNVESCDDISGDLEVGAGPCAYAVKRDHKQKCACASEVVAQWLRPLRLSITDLQSLVDVPHLEAFVFHMVRTVVHKQVLKTSGALDAVLQRTYMHNQ